MQADLIIKTFKIWKKKKTFLFLPFGFIAQKFYVLGANGGRIDYVSWLRFPLRALKTTLLTFFWCS